MPSDPESAAVPGFRFEGRPLVSARDVAGFCGTEYGPMLWLLYKAPETARYRAFEIPKRSGGMRPIHAPIGLLRELQDRFKFEFDTVYGAHPSAHGFIDQRSVVTNASLHTGRRWVLNVDLEDFFPSINFGRIRGLLMKPPFEMGPAAAAVCAQILTHRNGLPQGAPTSPVLSNLIALPLDRMLLRLARQHHVAYSRYADDITFSCNAVVFPPSLVVREEAEAGVFRTAPGPALAAAITRCGFRINERKVRLQGRGVRQAVTGICVNQRVNVGRERIRRLRAMLHAWQKFGLALAAAEHFRKWRRGFDFTAAKDPERAFRRVVYGNLAWVKMVRGADDPVFLKLCAKLLDLDPNPSRFLRLMVFGDADFDVFISHATEDKAEIARPIFAACEAAGIKAFLDEAHIGWGENFTKKINTALGAARTIIVVVSGHSVAKEWPLAEINTALAFDIEGKKRVLVVMVGDPDLTRLPLIKTKNYVVWTGDATHVVERLRPFVPDRSSTAEPTDTVSLFPKLITATTSVPQVKPHDAADLAPVNRGWLSRLWGRKPGN